MHSRGSVLRLMSFVQKLVRSRVKDKEGWKRWRKRPSNEAFMEECFGYVRRDGMPSITALVSPFFHPELPLIGLNYSPVAHNVLHAYPQGWTQPLRSCRGIVFDRRGKLVALPFPKFFNYGEMPETTDLPHGPVEATEKHDGHLGIIFRYKGAFHLTTRGSFTSATSVLGNGMLAEIVERRGWASKSLDGFTILVEIIHPKTRVHVRYRGRPHFRLIGMYIQKYLMDPGMSDSAADGTYRMLADWARELQLPLTACREFSSVEELRGHMADLRIRNREGYVARFGGGLRVKFKFQSYINLMVAEKLSYTYIMNRIISGNLDRMIGSLEEEIRENAYRMVDELMRVAGMDGSEKERRQYLYALVPERQSTAYYRTVCRKFIRHLDGE